MSVHTEINLENEICHHLASNGWLYSEGDAGLYDRQHALLPDDICLWIQASQPKAWETLLQKYGTTLQTVLLSRIRDQLDARGTLDVLRHGIDIVGLKHSLPLAQFKPALAMNPTLQARYAANRLRVVRQVRYSVHNQNALDLVLFLNGIPVATLELKTDFTQSVQDAVDQYRFDRNPRPKGQSASEPLLEFPRGALVHFAVSNREVHMTTRLTGTSTLFLPFNKGDGGGKGNPVNPTGHGTAYLWEEVLARESWLEILGRYLVRKLDTKKKLVGIIFPRYHQLDVTRKLLAALLEGGPGQKFLIQHSAGSGKTNSIAWTAHFLADLHDAQHKKLFDTVLVVSDRTVLDAQLQEAIFDFERTTGVVASITGKSQSKSHELIQALSGNKKIVVCTIQTFPAVLKKVHELATTEGKRFAVIADEAHSSQSGDASKRLKMVLSPDELKELADGGEISTEDILAAQMSAQANVAGITFVAFTATPKPKTLELFGRRPNPDLPASDSNIPGPFHVYSMRQAIEEKFILDVLRGYTPYKLAFKLASGGQEWDEQEVEKSAALKGIMKWVALHPYNIIQKVQVVVEHFRENVAPLLNGQAKAMVVLGSRLEAVRWQLAVNRYINDRGYKMGALVAFSGEVSDEESSPDPLSETSVALNPTLKGRDIRKAFATEEYHLLLVANKFQTGFDQPLLCGMYVDKKLSGIQAVQTLSRLNRAHPGKDTTYILDFKNDPDDILKAFKPYYETAELSGVSDPNVVFNLRAKLDATGYYDDHEVDRVVAVELNPKATQAQLIAAVGPVANRLVTNFALAKQAKAAALAIQDEGSATGPEDVMKALVQFKHDLGTFQRVYSFLSQIMDYGNTALEKRAIFFRRLLPLLEFGREREGVDVSQLVLTHHKLRNEGQRTIPLGVGDAEKLNPITEAGSGEVQDKEKVRLAEIIDKVNQLFDGQLTDGDKLIYVNSVIKGKLLESDVLVEQATHNTKEQFASSPDLTSALMDAIMDALTAHTTMSKQALNSEKVRHGIRDILLGPAKLYEALREKGMGG